MNPRGGPPMLGGPVGANFNALLRFEPCTGRVDLMSVPPGAGVSEPAHVPDPQKRHDGWLLSVVDLPNSLAPGDYLSELWVIEADDVAKGAIAKVRLGIPLRSQVHGTWVSRAKLDSMR